MVAVRVGIVVLVSAAFLTPVVSAWSQETPRTVRRPVTGPDSASELRPGEAESFRGPQAKPKKHPLDAVLPYARAQYDYLRQNVRDFTCRVIKRERIEGKLQDYFYVDLAVREQQESNGQVIEPFSVFLQFVAPKEIAGRRVLYVEGENDGRMLVRKGGRRFSYVVVDLDPQGETAMAESRVPITDIGFTRMLKSMIERIEQHKQADPDGLNTKVQIFRQAKINGRSCTQIRLTHPERQKELTFHVANLYIDDELHVPVRIDAYDWPTKPGEESPLIGEFTYTEVRLNPGLTDAHFSPEQLEAR